VRPVSCSTEIRHEEAKPKPSPRRRRVRESIVLDHLSIHQGGAAFQKHNSNRFLPWHRDYIKVLEDYLISQNMAQFVPLPKWDPGTPIPDEFFAVNGGIDSDCPEDLEIQGACDPLENQNPGSGLPRAYSTDLCDQTPFDFDQQGFTEAFENWHDGTHGAVGGAMARFTSPAAPIFWLWHSFVDDVWYEWQCDCGLDEGGVFDVYDPDEKHVDLVAGAADAWIRDSYDDIANEPNNESDVVYECENIWVRNGNETHVGDDRYTNEHQHENPEYSVVPAFRPYIYVKVRNRGCLPISGQLHTYWANAKTGLTWPGDFTEVQTSPVGFVNVAPGRDIVAEYHWLDIPEPNEQVGSHFCLVARFVADPPNADPINGEQNNVKIKTNVRNSNQIAQKNVTIVNDVRNAAAILIGGASTLGIPVKLTFEVPEAQEDDHYFDHGSLQVALGELFPIWIAGGAQGNGVVHLVDDVLLVTGGPGSSIENLFVGPGEQYLIELTFDLLATPCEDDTTEFAVRLNEYEQAAGGDVLLGGNTYLFSPDSVVETPLAEVFANGPRLDCAVGAVSLSSSATPPAGETIVQRQWLLDGVPIAGADQADHIATETGNYSILVTYSNGCDSMSLPVKVAIDSPPPNDDACAAAPLELDVPFDYSIYCATPQPAEVSPGAGSGAFDGCRSDDGWCSFESEIQNSVWFTFTAPDNGAVSIRVGEHDHVNGQLAVWQTTFCDDFNSYTAVAANDDNGDTGVWGTDPALEDLSGLTPGSEYYIQLDGFDGWPGTGTITVSIGCPADLDGSGGVGINDFLNMLAMWGPCADCDNCPADFDGNCEVNVNDFLILLGNWGPCP
jgi:hypothetical protein